MNKLSQGEVKEFASNRRKISPSGLVTRSQAWKDTGEYSSILAYEVDEDNHLETSGINPSQEKKELNCNYLAISACAKPVEEKCIESVFSTQDLIIPTDIDEALQNPTWKKPMDHEYDAFIKKKVWEVILPPPDTNIVGSRWTHICKCNQDRTVRDKSRVVAQGFTQTFGVNYDETYAPVSQLVSLWTICMIVAWNNWLIHQMDIYNTYVNADLEELIYVQQPPGYIQQSDQHVLKLKKLCTDSNNLDKHGTSVYLPLWTR